MGVVIHIAGVEQQIREKALGILLPRLSAAEAALKQDIIRDTDEFVPYRTGHLAASATPVQDGVAYTAEYASDVVSKPPDYEFSKDVHTEATSQFIQESISLNKARWVADFKQRVGGI